MPLDVFHLGPNRVDVLHDSPGFGFAEGRFAPGTPPPPPHRHDWDEGFYVVAGSLLVTVEDETVTLEPGAFALAPAGSLHTFEVSGDDEAVFAATFSSGRGLAYLRDMAQVLADGPPDAALATLHARHGVTTA